MNHGLESNALRSLEETIHGDERIRSGGINSSKPNGRAGGKSG